MIRKPAVAGQFYPADVNKLNEQLESFMDTEADKSAALGVISPHAGYMYSGRVAGSAFSRINVPDTVIILAPNHTGYGEPYSIWPDGSWQTPLGNVIVDTELVDQLTSECNLLSNDYEAHLFEHSAEVIIPFLQHINPKVKIAVIVIMSRNINELKELGKSLSTVIKNYAPNALVVASSDMTHQESQGSANRKDKIAIDEIIKLDENGLYDKVKSVGISMCGISPAISMLVCSKERGASTAILTKYETSGETSGDYNHVVGYAGVIIK